MGLELAADPGHQLNPLTAVKIPGGIEDLAVRRKLMADYHIEVGGGLGMFAGKVWRIGLMGEGARESNVFALLSALENILSQMDYEVASGASLSAAQRALMEAQRAGE